MQSIGRILHALLTPFIIITFRFKHQPRTRVWLTNPDGQILLVKTWLSHQRWSLPGGGIEKNESALQAIQREVREETGYRLDIGVFEEIETVRLESMQFVAIIFRAHVDTAALPPLDRYRKYEIIERRWVDPHDLPDNTSPLVHHMTKTLALDDRA